MNTPDDAGDITLEQRVANATESGQRCASCFVRVLRDEGVRVPDQVAELAPYLEWGLGGSGLICGVLLAALLAKVLQQDTASHGADLPPPYVAPGHEWLDALTPRSEGIANRARWPALARRLTTLTRDFGGVDCERISGMARRPEGDGLGGTHDSAGNAQRCIEFIVETARAYLESVDPADRRF